MLRSIAFALLAALALPALTPTARAEDKVVGAIWEMYTRDKDGKNVKTIGKFRATTDGKVFHDGKVVGSHKANGDDIELVVTDHPKGLNGTFKGTKVSKAASEWGGRYTIKSNGKEIPIWLKLVKD